MKKTLMVSQSDIDRLEKWLSDNGKSGLKWPDRFEYLVNVVIDEGRKSNRVAELTKEIEILSSNLRAERAEREILELRLDKIAESLGNKVLDRNRSET